MDGSSRLKRLVVTDGDLLQLALRVAVDLAAGGTGLDEHPEDAGAGTLDLLAGLFDRAAKRRGYFLGRLEFFHRLYEFGGGWELGGLRGSICS